MVTRDGGIVRGNTIGSRSIGMQEPIRRNTEADRKTQKPIENTETDREHRNRSGGLHEEAGAADLGRAGVPGGRHRPALGSSPAAGATSRGVTTGPGRRTDDGALSHARAAGALPHDPGCSRRGEKGDATSAHAWLARAARARRDAEWRCRHCGASHREWSAVCPDCSSFDTLIWPGAGEHAPVIIASEPVPEALPQKRPPPREERTVSLPPPPDDPGPGGLEY